MSQAKVNAVNGDSHKANLSNGHTSDDSSSLEKFVEAFEHFRSNACVNEVYTTMARVRDLEHQVEGLKNAKETLAIKYEEDCLILDETHAASLGKVQNQRNDLERRFEEVKKELLKEEKAREKEKSAKEEANARVEQITNALRKQKDLYLGLESKKSEFENKAKAANEQIEILQSEIRLKDVEKLARMQELNDTKATNDSLSTKLESTNKELRVWEGYTNHLHSDNAEELSDKFSKIWKSSCGAISLCFKEGLKRGVIQNDEAWIEFKRLANLSSNIPIPQSESTAAKQMCVAAVLSVLARSLSQHIFTPTYVLKENIRLRDTLFREAIDEPKRESLLRGLLASIFANAQKQDEEDRIQTVVREVSQVVQTIADDLNINNLRSELGKIVRTAQQLWYQVQTNREFFDSIVELNALPDWQWKQLKPSDKVSPSSQNTSEENLEMGENLLVIFPGVYCMHEDGYESIYSGFALSKSQTVTAAKEVEKTRQLNEISKRSELIRPAHPKLRRSSTATATESTTDKRRQNIVKENFLD